MESRQRDLFFDNFDEMLDKNAKVIHVLDEINQRFGRQIKLRSKPSDSKSNSLTLPQDCVKAGFVTDCVDQFSDNSARKRSAIKSTNERILADE
jgi:hypothetical protein